MASDLEPYAAACTVIDGLYTQLCAQVRLFREGANNERVIEAMLDLTIPKTPQSCAIAAAVQFIANGRTPSTLVSGLFKDRRACLLLLVNGEAAAKAIYADDIMVIGRTAAGYSVVRSDGAHNGASHTESAGARGRSGRTGNRIGGRGGRGGRGGSNGGSRRRDDTPEQASYRAASRPMPYAMSPERVNDILENAVRAMRETPEDEFPPAQRAAPKQKSSAPASGAPASSAPSSSAPASSVPTASEQWGDEDDEDFFFDKNKLK